MNKFANRSDCARFTRNCESDHTASNSLGQSGTKPATSGTQPVASRAIFLQATHEEPLGRNSLLLLLAVPTSSAPVPPTPLAPPTTMGPAERAGPQHLELLIGELLAFKRPLSLSLFRPLGAVLGRVTIFGRLGQRLASWLAGRDSAETKPPAADQDGRLWTLERLRSAGIESSLAQLSH